MTNVSSQKTGAAGVGAEGPLWVGRPLESRLIGGLRPPFPRMIEMIRRMLLHVTGYWLLITFHGRSRLSILGKAIVSRMWSIPQIHATVRSTPNPKPLCGVEP